MTKVELIEREVATLSPGELVAFAEWFAAFEAEAWDRQFEADALAGRLDAAGEAALEADRRGETKPL
ncbi:MAG: hypothetical protein U0575_09755 [Phycisphaerales bacterium]